MAVILVQMRKQLLENLIIIKMRQAKDINFPQNIKIKYCQGNFLYIIVGLEKKEKEEKQSNISVMG